MRRPRRNHTAAFEAKVAIAALKSDEMLAALAERFDIDPNQITQWRTQGNRNDTALQRQGRQEFRNGRLLVRFLRGRPLPQNQSGTCRKGADQMQRCRINLARAATGLAFDGGPRVSTKAGCNRPDPAAEGRFKLVRVNQAEQAPEGVVRGNAIFRPQVAAQPIQPFLCPQLNLNKRVGPNQYPIDGNDQQLDQVVFDLASLPGVGNRDEYIRQPQFASRLHGIPKKTENYTNQAIVNSPRATR